MKIVQKGRVFFNREWNFVLRFVRVNVKEI